MVRGLIWLLALAFLALAVASDGGPADPARGNGVGPGHAAISLLVYHWADCDPRIGLLEVYDVESDGVRLPLSGVQSAEPVPGVLRPAPGIAAYASSPAQTNGLAAMLRALRLAECQALETPVRIDALPVGLLEPVETPLRMNAPTGWFGGRVDWLLSPDCGATILPMGPPGLAEQFPELCGYGTHFTGSTLACGSAAHRANVERLWEEAHFAILSAGRSLAPQSR